MKKSKFTGEQIAFALRQAGVGTPVAEICRKMGVSEATYYRWTQLYGGLGPSKLRKMRQLEEENQKLKRLVADLSLDKVMIQEVLAKKCGAWPIARDRPLGAKSLVLAGGRPGTGSLGAVDAGCPLLARPAFRQAARVRQESPRRRHSPIRG